jgi:hypothetical protein
MSQVDAKSFFARLARDPALRQAAVAELQGKTGSTSKRLIELGGRHGLTFNDAELRTALEEQQQATGEGELTDADLDGVAGGSFLSNAFSNVIKTIGEGLSTTARKS